MDESYVCIAVYGHTAGVTALLDRGVAINAVLRIAFTRNGRYGFKRFCPLSHEKEGLFCPYFIAIGQRKDSLHPVTLPRRLYLSMTA